MDEQHCLHNTQCIGQLISVNNVMKPSVMCVQVYSHKNEVNAVVLWMYGTACSTTWWKQNRNQQFQEKAGQVQRVELCLISLTSTSTNKYI